MITKESEAVQIDVSGLMKAQRGYFSSGDPHEVSFLIRALKGLKKTIGKLEKEIFQAFSHIKSVMHRASCPNVLLRHPPYKGKLPIARQILIG